MFELHARKAESIAGTKLATLEEVVGDRMLVRLLAIKADSHPSVTHWTTGILEPCCQRECYRRSFLPAADSFIYPRTIHLHSHTSLYSVTFVHHGMYLRPFIFIFKFSCLFSVFIR